MIVPLMVGSLAITITLFYASYRDIQERRVPVRTWYPMLSVSLPMAAAFYLLDTADIRAVLGFLALTAIMLYDMFWLSAVSTRENRFVTCIFLSTVLGLLGASWWVSGAGLPLLIPLGFVIAGILCYATYLDIQERAVPVRVWYLTAVLFAYALGEYSMFQAGSAGGGYLFLTAIICLLMQVFINLHLMGGADGYAFIFIGLSIPVFPLLPLTGIPNIGYFPLSVLVNALLLNIVTPLGIFAWNILKGHRAPLTYLFLGFPVRGERIGDSFGFLMEEIEEREGQIVQRFIPVRHLVRMMFAGKRALSTQKMKSNPDQYARELALIRRAGQVWIQYGIPFIIPITAGFITALLFGDIFYYILTVAGGI